MALKTITMIMYIVGLSTLFMLLNKTYLYPHVNGLGVFLIGFIQGYFIGYSAVKLFKLD